MRAAIQDSYLRVCHFRALRRCFLGLAAIVCATSSIAQPNGYNSYVEVDTQIFDVPTQTLIQPWQRRTSDGELAFTEGTSTSAQTTNAGGTFGGTTLNGFASSDLSTGSLKAYAYAERSAPSPTTFASVRSHADFSDSFQSVTGAGSPFDWSGNAASFNMTLTGNVSTTLATRDTLLWNAGIFILEKGTFANVSPLDAVYQAAISFSQWGDGSLDVTVFQDLGIVLSHSISGDLATGVNMSFEFAPGGDFDWAIFLDAVGQPGFNAVTTEVDLASTLTVTYVAPDGATTVSASGVFPGSIAAVPEPSTALLLGLGGAFVARLSRRRRS